MTPALGFGEPAVIMKTVDRTIGLKVNEEEEDIGLDVTQLTEGVRRLILNC